MQAFLGAAVVAASLAILIDGGPARRRLFRSAVPLSDGARRGLMGVLLAASALLAVPALIPALRGGLFAFCGACPLPAHDVTASRSPLEAAHAFLLGSWYYTATVLPVFVLACGLSGALSVRGRLRVRGMLGAFGLAAILPVCSCGVVPLGKAMIDRGGPSVRAGVMFLAAAPLLSPIVLILGGSVLGIGYVVVRVAASFLMAAAAALVIPSFLESRSSGSSTAATALGSALMANTGEGPEEDPEAGAHDGRTPPGGASVLRAGWAMLTGLLRYVLYGVVLGAAVAAALPGGLVARVLGAGPLSMAAAVVVGLPVNLCAGEEILLTAPLASMGFSMGHAIAFALAGTGICASSLPLLRAVLGRRATLAWVGLYLVVPFVLGVLISALPAAPALEPRVFPEAARQTETESSATPQSLIDKSG